MSQPNILVADDSRTIQTIIRRTLHVAGYDVTTVSDGRQALQSAQAECPDLIIMDLLMPEMDGFAACMEIRALGEPWCSLPIIFLSKLQGNAVDSLGLEFGAYLPKPIQPVQLVETVRSLLNRSQPVCAIA
jgi:DNA-binding response OmpR family regulator